MIRVPAVLRRLRALAAPRPKSATRDESSFGDDDDDEPLPEVVRVEIRDSIDLHSFPPRDIPAVVREYLREARARGFSRVRIIHGKGTGTQRAVVRRILAETNFVIDCADAPAHSGGWGATVARLDTTPDDPR